MYNKHFKGQGKKKYGVGWVFEGTRPPRRCLKKGSKSFPLEKFPNPRRRKEGKKKGGV